MPTKCEDCGKDSYSIYFTREWKKLCGKCYKKVRKENEKPVDALEAAMDRLPKRQIPGKW